MMTQTATRTKVCPRCTVEFPRTPEFFGKGQNADGMHSWCIPCRRSYGRAKADLPAARRRAATWSAEHPGASAVRAKGWRERFPEKKAAGDRRWRSENPERARSNRRRWQEENRQRWLILHALAEANRRVRKARNGGFCTAVQWAARVAYFGGVCWMCGGPWNSVDHVIPLSRGGTGWPSNLRPACTSCNASKGAKPHKEVLS